jgi:alkaline phosphatase D
MNFSRRELARLLGAGGMTASFLRGASADVFAHGVASGDPLEDRVILWTRVTPQWNPGVFGVRWAISDEPTMRRVLRRGETVAHAGRDYTVKVDAAGLEAGRTYYYQFTALGERSPVGRTRTLPAGAVDRLRFCVASCSNYPYGYFNAYRSIAKRADLDFVLHLGDYIYEYADKEYGDGSAIGRVPMPNKEIVTLADYRDRYAQYRRDADLQEVHRQHPFIVVWDDHESANDSWRGGAENHDPDKSEGEWAARKAAAIQAWNEWLPVRENANPGLIYRTFRIGDLADLVMLDTRLYARDEQVAANSQAIFDETRSLLGAEQERWLYGQLAGSKARGTRWRILGQQVMMGQLFNTDGTPFNADQWDGYVASRNRLLGYAAQNQIGNLVVLTGDIHSSWGNDLSFNPFDPKMYTGSTGAGSVGVEMVCPGITSPGIDDAAQAAALEGGIRATHPHVKYLNLFRRGYLLVDMTKERTQGEWYYPDTIVRPSVVEELGGMLQVESGRNTLRTAPAPTMPRPAALLA